MRRTATVSAMLVLLASGQARAQVYLRTQSEPISGEVSRVGPEGIAIGVAGAVKTIGWDRVREVRGEHGAAAAKEMLPLTELWRARMRLERGDFGAAEPILDGLVARERGIVGPTAAVVFEGLVRCRLRRGAQAGAVWAWLEWVRVRGGTPGMGSDISATWVGGKIDAAPIFDAQTGLITSLPPVFLRDASLDAAAANDEWNRFLGTEPATAELAMLYRAAVRFEAGLDPEIGTVSSASESVRLVADVVLARAGDDAQRKVARGNLQARADRQDVEPWVECWCRVGLGRSLVRESDPELKRAGVVQLLHAPSRFTRFSASAASISLAEAAVALHDLGDELGAVALKAELTDRFARSNAMGWARLREVKAPTDKAQTFPVKDATNAPEKKGG